MFSIFKLGESSSSCNSSEPNSPSNSKQFNHSQSQTSNFVKKTSPSPSTTFFQTNKQSQQGQSNKLSSNEIHTQPPTPPPQTSQNETFTDKETKKASPIKYIDEKTTEEVREHLTLALQKNNYTNNYLNVDNNNNLSKSRPSQTSEENPENDINEQELNQSSTVSLLF